jgi:CRP-like cAMP-binding protein
VLHHAPDEWLGRAGEPTTSLLAIVSGRAGVEIAGPGREPIVVATVHDGEIVGWSWFVEPYRWRFDVVALEPVQLLAVDAASLRACCAADHELGYHVLRRLVRVVASRLDATRLQLADVYGPAR